MGQSAVKEGVRRRPWTWKKSTGYVGRVLQNVSLYDANNEYIAGGFSEREAVMICAAMKLYGVAARQEKLK